MKNLLLTLVLSLNTLALADSQVYRDGDFVRADLNGQEAQNLYAQMKVPATGQDGVKYFAASDKGVTVYCTQSTTCQVSINEAALNVGGGTTLVQKHVSKPLLIANIYDGLESKNGFLAFESKNKVLPKYEAKYQFGPVAISTWTNFDSHIGQQYQLAVFIDVSSLSEN